MQVQISREAAWTLLCDWTKSDSLRRHMLAVETAMRGYAPRFDGDPELWGLTGLLHDLDYERYPNLGDGHPRRGRRVEQRDRRPLADRHRLTGLYRRAEVACSSGSGAGHGEPAGQPAASRRQGQR